MLRQVSIKASEGHRGFGKLLRRVYSTDEHLVVERDGFAVAVLMSYQEYRKLVGERSAGAFEQLSRELGREIERQGITEEQLLEETEQASQELFEEEYGARIG